MVVPFMGTYLAMIAINVFGSLLFLALDIPKPEPRRADAPVGRSRWEIMKTPTVAVAMICAMVSYALMNLVMTSTPLAVVGCGFEQNTAADVVSAHVLAMFIPSFFTGHLIARFGTTKIVAAGLFILGCAGAVALQGVNVENFFLALILLGVGWNFGFIGATTMLASAHNPEEERNCAGHERLFRLWRCDGRVTVIWWLDELFWWLSCGRMDRREYCDGSVFNTCRRGFDLARHAETPRLNLFRTACSNADFIQNSLDPCGGRGRGDLRLQRVKSNAQGSLFSVIQIIP